MKSSNGLCFRCFGASLVVLLFGCGSRQPETSLPPEVTTSIEQAINNRDIPGCVARFSEDAEILAEDAPVVRGRQAIEEFCTAQAARELAFDTQSTMNVVSGELAFEQGTYRVRNVREGAYVEYGEYLNVWRRSGGEWKIFRSMFNVTEAPEVRVSVSEGEEEQEKPIG